jgi:hypothetical protein
VPGPLACPHAFLEPTSRTGPANANDEPESLPRQQGLPRPVAQIVTAIPISPVLHDALRRIRRAWCADDLAEGVGLGRRLPDLPRSTPG